MFGAPERLPDHADRAVRAARAIAAAIHERFGGEVRIGIGISSAPVLTEATLRAMKMRDSGVYAKREAELRGIADPVRLYSTDPALDERSTLRRKSLITDA